MKITARVDGPVGRVRFEGEKGVQIFNADARRQLGEVLSEVESAEGCRVVVFEAEGRTFIAGADIKELQRLDYDSGLTIAREGQRLMQRIAELNAVTVAAINAACAGGGCELALACDLRFAAEGAVIGLPEVKLGLIPGWGGTVRAVRLFGSAVARRMILSGQLLPASEAGRLGIVNDIFGDDVFRDEVEERVQQLLAGGPQSIAAAKRLIAQFEAGDVEAELAAEAEVFAACCGGEESTEGTTAFLEKRAARWG